MRIRRIALVLAVCFCYLPSPSR